MLAPFLLVGVGGSGGKTLRAVRKELLLRLREVGWTGDFPACWQLVHIDVPSIQDGVADMDGLLPPADFLGLVKRNVHYLDIDSTVRHALPGTPGLEAMGSWRPDPPRSVGTPIHEGAGQFRALGRMVAVGYSGTIKDYLADVVNRFGGPAIQTEIMELSRKFGADTGGVMPAPVAMVITSIAGGTGAGMAIDVCDLLRASGEQWAGDSFGIFYTPDVFNGLSPAARAGVNANALGSLLETLNAFWSLGHALDTERHHLGLPQDQYRRGVGYPMLVGSSNTGGVQLVQQVEVYKAAAKGLSALMVSEAWQSFVTSYMKNNVWGNSGNMTDNLPIKAEVAGNAMLPFSAMGFARVSLGRDLFGQYARERLSRLAVDRLLRQHLEAVPEKDRTVPDQAVKVLVDQQFERFLRAVGFYATRKENERVTSINHVVDAIRPAADVRAAYESAMSDIESRMRAEAGQHPGARWLADLDARVNNLRDAWIAAQSQRRTERIAAWAEAIQLNLAEVTAWYAAAFGLRTAQGLLARLIDHLQAYAREMETEAEVYGGWARQAPSQAQQILVAVQGAFAFSHGAIGKAAEKLVGGVVSVVDAETRTIVAGLLDDARENLVMPLADKLLDAREGLENEENKPDSAIRLWPSDDSEPTALSPGKTEFLVESIGTYPRQFLQLVNATADDLKPQEALAKAVKQILTAATPRRPVSTTIPPSWENGLEADGQLTDPQQMITYEFSWEPLELGTGNRARPKVSCRSVDVVERAEKWLFENQFPFERFLREDLQHYVQSPTLTETVRTEREHSFMDAFARAASAASPLIGVDVAAVMAAHGGDVSVAYQFTRIPFGRGSTVGSFVADYIVSHGLIEGGNIDQSLDQMLSADGRPVHRVDIFSTLNQPYHAVVFDSINRPIRQEWNSKLSSESKRRAFWQWRRTRNLQSVIPATREVVEDMCRGWFTASLLGQTDVQDFDDPDLVKVSIYDPGTRAMVAFPRPFLEYDPTDRRSLLPGVLLNLGLAIITYAEAPNAFLPYHRLLSLGQSQGGDLLNGELLRFIKQGTVAAGASVPEGSSADAAERQQWLLQRVEKSVEGYRRLNDLDVLVDADITPQWEMRAVLIAAQDQLADRIRKLTFEDELM